jgi:hypothetical protein
MRKSGPGDTRHVQQPGAGFDKPMDRAGNAFAWLKPAVSNRTCRCPDAFSAGSLLEKDGWRVHRSAMAIATTEFDRIKAFSAA